ncbi:MAG: metal-dependent hydrolase, partial [Rhodospirillales bacterium]|nr:metal-dependent hydrolase [Rhodospirillales bacterium]
MAKRPDPPGLALDHEGLSIPIMVRRNPRARRLYLRIAAVEA